MKITVLSFKPMPHGAALKDDRGKQRYDQMAKWASRAASEAFRRAAVHALKQAFPAALADGEAHQ